MIGKILVGSVSFKGGFWGGIFGLVMFAWAIVDILDMLGMLK